MKSKLFLFIISTFFSLMLFAGNVTLQQAQKVALNFYFEKYNKFEGLVTFRELAIQSAYTETDGLQNFYFVFNISKGGFVMVAGDNRLNPVLGYSFTHEFKSENLPPDVKGWFHQFADQVDYARQNLKGPEEYVAKLWSKYLDDKFGLEKINLSSKEVEPLLTSVWIQGWPYNYFCPSDPAGPGGHVWLGCAALSLAQICHFWRWPEHGQGEHCYTPAQHPEYGEQCADFENTWYRWNEITDTINQPINFALAELLYHAGVSLDMNYGTIGSAPAGGYYGEAHLEYFRFDNAYEMIYRDSCTLEFFREKIRSVLDQGIPIPYAGASSNYYAIHMFNCDGYQDSLYFHFNLGSVYTPDGYYLIDGVSQYTSHQYCFSGVIPDTINNIYPLYGAGADTITALSGSVADGSGPIHNYLNNTQASWLITPQTEYDSVSNIIIMVKQLDLFDDNDRLYIYEGEDNMAPLLAELSTNSQLGEIESTGNKVFIEFITDGSSTASGFYLIYRSIQPVWCNDTTVIVQAAATFDDGSGSFYYYNSSSCNWFIDPGITEPLTLSFNCFDTEEENDVLKIYDGESQNLLAEISGYYEQPPEPVTAPSGKMMLNFQTNSSIQGQGWETWFDTEVGIARYNPDFGLNIIPNPVSSELKVSFFVPSDQQVSIRIFYLLGNMSIPILDNYLLQGNQSVCWNMDNLPAGLYYCCVQIGNERITKKIIKL